MKSMSLSAVQEFLTKISEDQALQEQIAKAMESDNDRQAVTDLARSKGFEFTAEELGQEIQNRENTFRQQIESGELSEDELESVAGGNLVINIGFASAKVPGVSIFSLSNPLPSVNKIPPVKW
jgi:predicted ribosomally synthesized peptide with nif11-like leader